MLTHEATQAAVGGLLIGNDGDTLGTISHIYPSADETPRFAAVHRLPRIAAMGPDHGPADGSAVDRDTSTGRTHVVPLLHPAITLDPDGNLLVPWSRRTVESAPVIQDIGDLSPAEERLLVDHYRSSLSHGDAEAVMTRSEELLAVTTRSQPWGRARLRTFVTTETQTVTVPVRREYVVMEVVPFVDERYESVAAVADDPGADNVVLVREEAVEVITTLQPVALARIEIATETVERVVTGAVRTEHVVAEGDLGGQRR